MDANKYVSLEEGAAELGLTTQQLQALYDDGKIYGVRDIENGTLEFSKSDIEACKERLAEIQDEIRGGINSVLDEEEDLLLDGSDLQLGNGSGINLNDDLSAELNENKGSSIDLGKQSTNPHSTDKSALRDDDGDLVLRLNDNPEEDVQYDPDWDGPNKNSGNSGIKFDAGNSGFDLDADDSGAKLNNDKNNDEEIEVEELNFDDLDDNEDSSNSDININFIDPARYYSLEDGARYLGIHTSELRDLREDGQIRGFLEADTLEFRGSDLIELKNKRDDKPFFSQPDQEDEEPVVIELEDRDAFNVKSNSSSADAVDELMLNDQDFLDAANATSQNSNSTRSVKNEDDVADDEDDGNADEITVTSIPLGSGMRRDDLGGIYEDYSFAEFRSRRRRNPPTQPQPEENEPTPPATSLPRRIWGTVTNLFSRRRKRAKINIDKALDINTEAILPDILPPTEIVFTDINDLRKKMVKKKKADLETITDPSEKMEIAQAIDNFNTLFIEIKSLQTLRKNLGKTSMTSKEHADVKQALVRLNTAIHHAVFTFSDYLDPNVPPVLDKKEEADILLPRMNWIIATLKNMNDNNLSYLLGQSVNKNGTVQEEYVESFLQKAQKALADYKKSLKK